MGNTLDQMRCSTRPRRLKPLGHVELRGLF
jgi:hypothetical protein